MRVAIVIIFFMSAVLTACTGGQQSIEDINYFEGTDGLTIEFVDNSPPPKVYASQQFPITLLIKNRGAWSVHGDFFGAVSISYDPLYFEEDPQTLAIVQEERTDVKRRGRSPDWPSGEDNFSTVALLKAKSLDARVGASTPLLVSLCYPYQTTLAELVCIDADPSNLDQRDQVCEAQDLSLTDQGAPVAITQVLMESTPAGFSEIEVQSNAPTVNNDGFDLDEQTTTERVALVRPTFRITVSNVGEGSVVQERGFEEQKLCTLDSNDRNSAGAVRVKGRLGNRDLICLPNDPLSPTNEAIAKLTDGSAEVVCMVSDNDLIPVKTNYQDILQLEAAYVYRLRETIDVEISDTYKTDEEPLQPNAACSDFHRLENTCKVHSATLGCGWCDASQSCLENTACAGCSGANQFDENSLECVGDCPSATPSATLRLQGDTIVSTCIDPRDGANYVNHQRCGCDENVYYTFLDEDTACPQDEKDYAIAVGQYNAATHTTTVTRAINDIAVKACSLVNSKNGKSVYNELLVCSGANPVVSLVNEANGGITVSCKDPIGSGLGAEHFRCGCSEDELYVKFLDSGNVNDCGTDINTYTKIVGDYNEQKKTTTSTLISFPVSTKIVCAYAKAHNGKEDSASLVI